MVEKFISFSTNETGHEQVSLSFHATVNKTLEFDPEYFYFSTYPDSAATKELSVRNSSKQLIRILSIHPSSALIAVTTTDNRIEPGEEIALSGSIRLKYAGTFSGNVEITTDHPKVPVFTIRYFALVKEKK